MEHIKVRSLAYEYPGEKELSFADFSLNAGENLLISGDSGSGKTTLLHLLAGLLTPDKGTVSYCGKDISTMEMANLDRFRGEQIGMIFQKHYFISGISVLENLKAARRFAGNKNDHAWLGSLMEQLEISHLANKKQHQLSEGEQQRFSIARALANEPGWVLADEPTSSIDDRRCEQFVRLINQSFSDKKTSWIIATHDQRLKKYFSTIYPL